MPEEFVSILHERDYAVESVLNNIRFFGILVLSSMDFLFSIGKNIRFSIDVWIFTAVFLGIFIIYYTSLKKVINKGKYYPLLKYFVSFTDMAFMAALFLYMRQTSYVELFSDISQYNTMIILFFGVYISLNSMRYGYRIIIFLYFLVASALSIYFIKYNMDIIFLSYVLILLAATSLISIWISYTINNIFLDYKKKARLMRYISSDLVKLADEGAVNLNLGGEEHFATVVFIDIRGFTSISDDLKPAEVVDILNIFFSYCSIHIKNGGGMIDKYIGDSVMALFGIPQTNGDDVLNAVNSVRKIFEELAEVNNVFYEKYSVELKLGASIHTGVVVSGNIGSTDRMDYTVIGDAVNVASRIESLNKKYGTKMLVSGTSYMFLKNNTDFEYVSEEILRGRKEKTQLYTLKNL